MNRSLVVVLLLAALGVGYLVGALSSASSSAGGGLSADAQVAQLERENERLRRSLGERGPRLDPGASLVGRGGTGTTNSGGTPTTSGTPGRLAQVESFDIATFDTAEDAFRQLLAFAATMFARGEEGHLELLAALSKNLFDKPGEKILEQLVGSEEQAVRFLYPLIRFGLNHDEEVVAMTETIFKTLAQDPKRLAEVDGNALELFTEGIAYMLPGMVGPERLKTLEGHARAFLDTPAETQPQSVQRVRHDVQRALQSWAPPLTPEEALDRLQSGRVSLEEIGGLLRRLTPDMIQTLDADALLGPTLERDGFRVLGLLRRLRLDADTLAKLDQRVINGALREPGRQAFIEYYLRFTHRLVWEKARPFIEAGLQQATGTHAGSFALAALKCQGGPDAAWIQWALETYTFSDPVRAALEKGLR